MRLRLFFLLCLLLPAHRMTYGQSPLVEYLVFNGRYDFTMFGNTNNTKGNSSDSSFDCDQDNKSSSSANFSLPPGATGIKKAILYWSGTGTGDNEIKLSGPGGLNQMTIQAEQLFTDQELLSTGFQTFFAARTDVTTLLQTHGQGQYTVSELDVDHSAKFCPQTLYSGWAIIVVYENPSLPLNTLKIYDGLKGYAQANVTFNISGLKILVPQNAKLGLLAWEGDDLPNLGTEGILINGNELVNALNPSGQLFNGTNSFAGIANNFNMDMDFFDISNFITSGTSSLDVTITAGIDIVLLNLFAIVFNNELPDATVKFNDLRGNCDSRDITLDYTIVNNPANDDLPAGIDIGFYANSPDGILLGSQKLASGIPLGDSASQSILLTIPTSLGDQFTIFAVAEDGNTVLELDEDNNTNSMVIRMPVTYDEDMHFGICEGDTLVWNNQVFTQPTVQDFNYVSEFGCDSIIHFSLDVQAKAHTDVDTQLCKGQVLMLPTGDSITRAGDYDLTFTSQYGCDSSVTVHFTYINNIEEVEITGDSVVRLGYELPLSIVANFTPDSIAWIPADLVDCADCTNVTALPIDHTLFSALLMDDYGCTLQASKMVKVIKLDEIFAPNAFSPNGDGLNEWFQIYTDRDVDAILEFDVYDRWGDLLFSGTDHTPGWDGRHHGKIMPPGVYAWVARIRFKDGRTRVYSGDVTLIR